MGFESGLADPLCPRESEFFVHEPDLIEDIGEDITREGDDYLVTTMFVKYNYFESDDRSRKILESVSISCLPNGMLQERYNLSARRTFWLAGRNAPTRGEAFRVRIILPRLKDMAAWRVQNIQLLPETSFVWSDQGAAPQTRINHTS